MIGRFVEYTAGRWKEDSMLASRSIIKNAMDERGFKHRRTEDQFTINGQYARNLQTVYAKEYSSKRGAVVDLVYFAADVLRDRLVIGLYRENPDIENGIYINTSQAIDLVKFNAEELERALNKLITPLKDGLK